MGHGHSLFSQHMSRKSEYNFFQFFTPFSKQRCLSSLLLLLFQGPLSADQVLGSSFTLIDFQLLGLNYFLLSEVSGEICLKFHMTIQLVFLSVLCPVPSALLEVFFACSFFFLCLSFFVLSPFFCLSGILSLSFVSFSSIFLSVQPSSARAVKRRPGSPTASTFLPIQPSPSSLLPAHLTQTTESLGLFLF